MFTADVKGAPQVDFRQSRRQRKPFQNKGIIPRRVELELGPGVRLRLPLGKEGRLAGLAGARGGDQLSIGVGVSEPLEEQELGKDGLVHADALRLGDSHTDGER